MELYALNGEPSGEFVIFADLITGLIFPSPLMMHCDALQDWLPWDIT
jgi:hypothetical protein